MCRRLPRTWRFLRPFHRGNTRSRYTRADKLREAGILARGGLMETSAPAQSASGRYPRVASSIHLILVLAAIGGWAIAHKIVTDQLSATANPNRVHFYVVTLLFDWLLRTAALGRNVSMLPHGGIELTLWIALSVTAGICEETIFRGYLQRQFMALTQSAPAGILLSAAAFGAAHAYQGFRMVILIGLYGGMFGILAYWRGSVRPGMIAHAWNDSWNGMLASLVRH